MTRHAEPARILAPDREADQAGAAPATSQARSGGAAAQLAAIRRTLAGGLAVQLRGKVAKAAPVQRKLQHHGKDLDLKGEKASGVVRRHADSPHPYVLSDDDKPQYTLVEILDGTKKYLLGEAHDKSDWDENVRSWSHVPKMLEKGKSSEDELRFHPLQGENPKLPLENRFAYTTQVTTNVLFFSSAILTHSQGFAAKAIDEKRLIYANAIKAQGQVHQWLEELKRMDLVFQGLRLEYKRAADEPSGAMMAKMLAINLLVKALAKLSGASLLVVKSMNPDAPAPQPQQVIDKAAGELEAYRPSLRKLLAAIAELAGASKDESALLMKGADSGSREGIPAAMAIRERAMIANIKKAKPPLLVQIGDKHVDPVHAATASETVPVHKDDLFALHTFKWD